MRKKFVAALAVGTLGLSGFALAGPALAAVGAPTAAAVASAPVDRVKEVLSGLVSDKTLTQAQADKVASALQKADLGSEARGGRGGHGRFGGGAGGGFGAAATALGLSEADLRTAVKSGQTLAQVAKDKGVSVDTLIAALVKSEKAQIAKEVAAGKLTQAKADERLADLTKRITDRVNSVRPARSEGGPEGGRGDRSGTPDSSSTPSASPSVTS